MLSKYEIYTLSFFTALIFGNSCLCYIFVIYLFCLICMKIEANSLLHTEQHNYHNVQTLNIVFTQFSCCYVRLVAVHRTAQLSQCTYRH